MALEETSIGTEMLVNGSNFNFSQKSSLSQVILNLMKGDQLVWHSHFVLTSQVYSWEPIRTSSQFGRHIRMTLIKWCLRKEMPLLPLSNMPLLVSKPLDLVCLISSWIVKHTHCLLLTNHSIPIYKTSGLFRDGMHIHLNKHTISNSRSVSIQETARWWRRNQESSFLPSSWVLLFQGWAKAVLETTVC